MEKYALALLQELFVQQKIGIMSRFITYLVCWCYQNKCSILNAHNCRTVSPTVI